MEGQGGLSSRSAYDIYGISLKPGQFQGNNLILNLSIGPEDGKDSRFW